jgi:hypothetical protein
MNDDLCQFCKRIIDDERAGVDYFTEEETESGYTCGTCVDPNMAVWPLN